MRCELYLKVLRASIISRTTTLETKKPTGVMLRITAGRLLKRHGGAVGYRTPVRMVNHSFSTDIVHLNTTARQSEQKAQSLA
jgi:hypothetical protein